MPEGGPATILLVQIELQEARRRSGVVSGRDVGGKSQEIWPTLSSQTAFKCPGKNCSGKLTSRFFSPGIEVRETEGLRRPGKQVGKFDVGATSRPVRFFSILGVSLLTPTWALPGGATARRSVGTEIGFLRGRRTRDLVGFWAERVVLESYCGAEGFMGTKAWLARLLSHTLGPNAASASFWNHISGAQTRLVRCLAPPKPDSSGFLAPQRDEPTCVPSFRAPSMQSQSELASQRAPDFQVPECSATGVGGCQAGV